MSPEFPPCPLERNPLSLATGIVVWLIVVRELRQRGMDSPWFKGIGFGLLVFGLSVFNLPLGVFFGVVVYLLVRR